MQTIIKGNCMEKTPFAVNLKNLRKENHVSQKDLADKISVSVKSVSHWETGYTEPSLTQLCMIADIFEISTDELLGRV